MTQLDPQPGEQPLPSGSPAIPAEVIDDKEPLEAGIEYLVAAEGLSPQEVLPQLEDRPVRRPLLLRRRVLLPLGLFLATCFTTWLAGACRWVPHVYLLTTGGDLQPLRQAIVAHWREGLIYMLCVQGILFAHELGHYVFTLIYRVRATLPFFLPFPL